MFKCLKIINYKCYELFKLVTIERLSKYLLQKLDFCFIFNFIKPSFSFALMHVILIFYRL